MSEPYRALYAAKLLFIDLPHRIVVSSSWLPATVIHGKREASGSFICA